MLIGEVADRSGVPARTIRFYEQARVLSAPQRSANGYRVYSERTIAELTFVKRAQRLGFSLGEISEVLGLGRSGRLPCSRVTEICDAHLDEIERQMGELIAFRRLLEDTRHKARTGCGFTREGFCNAIMGLQHE
jgi:DNA-binding transcriptional MerR regulator